MICLPFLVYTPWLGGLLQGRSVSKLITEAKSPKHVCPDPRAVCVGVRNGAGSVSLLRARAGDESGSTQLPGREVTSMPHKPGFNICLAAVRPWQVTELAYASGFFSCRTGTVTSMPWNYCKG